MLRVLHFVLFVFQRFPTRSGYSMQHERDMERAGFRPRSAGLPGGIPTWWRFIAFSQFTWSKRLCVPPHSHPSCGGPYLAPAIAPGLFTLRANLKWILRVRRTRLGWRRAVLQ